MEGKEREAEGEGKGERREGDAPLTQIPGSAPENCKYNASNTRENSNSKRVSLFWPTLQYVHPILLYVAVK